MYTHTHLFLGVVYHRVDPVAVFFRCVSICTFVLVKQITSPSPRFMTAYIPLPPPQVSVFVLLY